MTTVLGTPKRRNLEAKARAKLSSGGKSHQKANLVPKKLEVRKAKAKADHKEFVRQKEPGRTDQCRTFMKPKPYEPYEAYTALQSRPYGAQEAVVFMQRQPWASRMC